ncbi:hypothetical protein pEaSNUABM29_00052 [Erwinia phage pEa_SNUABM_29]|nr:hypothetical protein pEaSNUABM29_00052 [Erwinia phage pEa_SNUABM_29]
MIHLISENVSVTELGHVRGEMKLVDFMKDYGGLPYAIGEIVKGKLRTNDFFIAEKLQFNEDTPELVEYHYTVFPRVNPDDDIDAIKLNDAYQSHGYNEVSLAWDWEGNKRYAAAAVNRASDAEIPVIQGVTLLNYDNLNQIIFVATDAEVV